MNREKYKAVILKNEFPDHDLWVMSCEKFANELSFRIVDLTKHDWFDEINSEYFDVLLTKPPGVSSLFKLLYDERIYILAEKLGHFVYPSLDEILIYENKKFFSYWLKANSLPHPETNVFYFKDEADAYLKDIVFPIVAKSNIGGSGSGVMILKNYDEALSYVNVTFSGKGAPKRWGPNLTSGGLLKRGLSYLKDVKKVKEKLDLYKVRRTDVQKDFVILQEFVEHEHEWRIVVIGDSYFAHKKLKVGEKASGSLLKNYDNPPVSLFDFAKNVMEKFGFYSQAIDVFESKQGGFLINEMQCMFGQSDPYQMKVDGKPGRYRFINSGWEFEEGEFNGNESFDLRVEHVLKLLKGK